MTTDLINCEMSYCTMDTRATENSSDPALCGSCNEAYSLGIQRGIDGMKELEMTNSNSRRDLIEEVREGHSILEDYHYKCDLAVIETSPYDDTVAGMIEYCRTFDEASFALAHQHDKLRAWAKVLKEYDEAN